MSIQFSVTRIDEDHYKIIAQDENTIVRSTELFKADVPNWLRFELEQLRPVND